MPKGIAFLGLELVIQCHSCGATVPLDGPATAVTCGSCGRVSEVDTAVWSAALTGAVNDFVLLGRGVLEAGKLDRPGRDVEWARGPDRPPCLACETPIPAPPPGSPPTCPDCGATRELEPAPEFLRAADSRIVGLVRAPATEPPETRTLALPCQSCGASLDADGKTRMVTCPYCNTANVLPDEVWRALHPPPLRQRFWLHYQLTVDPRWEQPSPGRALAVQLAGTALFAGFFGFMGALVTASISLGKNQLSGDEIAPYVLPWIASLFVPLALLFFLGFVAHRRLIRPEHEAMGRLGRRNGSKVPVDILRPQEPSVVVATTTLALPDRVYRRLGGAGGMVRAWVTADGRQAEARPRPSGLG